MIFTIWDKEQKIIIKDLPDATPYLKEANKLRKSIYTKQQQILTKIVSNHELYTPYEGLVVIENVADKIKILNSFKQVSYELYYLIECLFETRKASDQYSKSMHNLNIIFLNDLKQLKAKWNNAVSIVSECNLKTYTNLCKQGFELLRALELEVKEATNE